MRGYNQYHGKNNIRNVQKHVSLNLHTRQQHTSGSYQVTNLTSQMKTAKLSPLATTHSLGYTVAQPPLSTVHTYNDSNSLQNSTCALIREMHLIWMQRVNEYK